MQKRVQYLDILKAISIFLVVFCHFVLLAETFAANVFMALCRLAVPVFFMVNGALLFARPFNMKKHISKMVTVYLVLAVWKLIYMLSIPAMTDTVLQANGIGEILTYLFLFGELPGIVNGHLWFIDALLAVYLVFPVIRIAYDHQSGHVTGRQITWFLAISCLVCTNGLYGLETLGDMLKDLGVPFHLSFNNLAAFQPFGKYGNMLGFFLLGALLAESSPQNKSSKSGVVVFFSRPANRRILGTILLLSGLAGFLLTRRYLTGHFLWDGVPMTEGYQRISVIFMAVGLFLICKDLEIRNRWFSAAVSALASRTLGIFYLHWFFGWMLAAPLTVFIVSHGIPFGIGANLLKNIALMIPAFLATLILERIPVINKLVK